jgi:hypothetical protein
MTSWLRTRALTALMGCTVALAAAGAVGPISASANPVTGAVNTTDDPGQLGFGGVTTGPCLNGPSPSVNCNIYAQKEDVFLSGSPVQAALGTGTYFFAVLSPGGQPDPNDGAALKANGDDPNLSDEFDAWTKREFSVAADGTITNLGGHFFDSANNKLPMAPYADTPNPGGVYILAVCKVPSSPTGAPGVDPSDCKYDAFKVKIPTPPTGPVAAGLTVLKDANPGFTRTFTWSITKAACAHGISPCTQLVKQIGGTVTFDYTVTVTKDSGTDSGWNVAGTITVTNPNQNSDDNSTVPVTGVEIDDSINDANAPCAVNGGINTALTIPDPSDSFSYTCVYSAPPASTTETNTVTVSWPTQTLTFHDTECTPVTSPCQVQLPGGSSDPFAIDFTFGDPTTVNGNCVTVTDTFNGVTSTLGTPPTCVTTVFTYSHTVNVPANDCQSYTNTATFAGASVTTGLKGSDSQTVTVCGPAATGALTIGFWKTTNGQNLIKTYCNNGSANLGAYLDGLGAASGPFSNAPTSCAPLATYVYNILNGATATNMNSMLKAQMLGTALDVWFSGPGWTSTTINNIKSPSKFLSHNNLGTFKMDTTAVCPMVDNLSTGTATCQGGTPSTNAVAAGAVPTSPMSMQAILDYASTTPSPFNGSTSSSVWYGGDRTKEEILKNIFDQFNNGLAFGSF